MIQETRILLPEDLKPLNSLAEYEARGGLAGLKKASVMPRAQIIAEVKKSGLRGRGGAGFPTAIKWESTVNDPSPTKYLVCNFAEGEPGTYKDRYLISKNPYQLIEGLLIAAYVIEAKQAFIGVKEKFTVQVNRLRQAIREMEAAKIMQPGYVEVVLGPDDYLFGEEKALLEVVDGRGALPRNMPPFLYGVRCTPTEYNPTVVNNAESLSHLPQILSKGADWFRLRGTADTPGTMIFTLSGDVKRPGMYELPMGTTLRQLLDEVGGGPAAEYPFKAVFSGVANTVITPDIFDTPLDFGSMRAKGSGVGSGGFIVYDARHCMVKIARMLSQFLAVSSCGQCVPCNLGCRVITRHLNRIEDGIGSQDDINAIFAECGRCTNQTRCFLPTQESKMISSIIQKFPEEFRVHLGRTCSDYNELVLPKIEYFDETTRRFTYEKPKVEV